MEELKAMSHNEFAQIATSRIRRRILRGFSDREKKILDDIKKQKRNIETHARDMIIMPEMVGATIKIHNGKNFEQVMIEPEMVAHYLGEFSLTRRKVSHNAPGIGATQSSAGAKKT